MAEPWDMTEAQRRQLREAQITAKRRERRDREKVSHMDDDRTFSIMFVIAAVFSLAFMGLIAWAIVTLVLHFTG